MSEELERLPEEMDAYTRRQMDLALMKARDIEGTMLNDLERAMNLVKRYQAAMASLYLPDPNEREANDLLVKYKMKKGPKATKPCRERQQQLERIVDPTFESDAEEIVEPAEITQGPRALPRGTE